jgi:seipin
VPVYLQFDHGAAPGILVLNAEGQKWPHGVAGLHGLVTRQKYDVSVEIRVPRSRANLDAGNWMLDLSLRAPAPSGRAIKNILGWDDESAESSNTAGNSDGKTSQSPSKTVAHSRRPAILTYRSWPTEHLHRFLRLPLYLTGFGTESETLSVSMLEGVYFHDAAPASLRLEVRSKSPLEVYGVQVEIIARLEGLRWVMYTYRLASACVFVAAFWATEMGVLVLTWGAVALLFGSASPSPAEQQDSARHSGGKAWKIKNELDDLSDTDRTFPTLSSQPPLRYSSPESKVKKEEHRSLADIPTAEPEDAEADDEEDDFVLESPLPRTLDPQALFTDSGLGTGMDSERDRERERVRRRGSGRSTRVKDEEGR